MEAVSMLGLPVPPADFRRLCAEADGATSPRGASLRRLAEYALDTNGLHRLSKSVTAAIHEGVSSPLTPMRLGLVSNGNVDFIVPALVASAARYGIALSVNAAPFGVTAQAAFDPASDIVSFKPDVVLLALDHREFISDFALASGAEQALDVAVAQVAAMARAFVERCQANVIVQTVATPPERLFGSFDRRQAGTPAWFVTRFNDRLCTEVCGGAISLLDVDAMASRVGVEAWFDQTQWITARLPFKQSMAPLYADGAARLLGAMRSKSRRVLVLDLDNTIWGGVIGDDGINGIQLGQGDPRGEAFLAVQKAALALRQRGILLALCSKNDADIALAAIRQHPAMLLKEGDFAAVRISWDDKASNIEAIAAELSLGLDSFVFLDDNPVEREQVRQALPQVVVPELPPDPASYARILLGGGYFEALGLSEEDRVRADLYTAQSQRSALLTGSRDLSDFLASLEMSIDFISEGKIGWKRFTELINKSNQFHLTTRRYNEAEIIALVESKSDGLLLQVRLADRFGDNGMISAIICRQYGNDWDLDTWVMSCRVLNRKVEVAVLNEIVHRARQARIRRLCGSYIATERNHIVRDHYAKLGFDLVEETPTASRWILDCDAFEPLAVPIKVIGA
jgi:FkbH-like protein